VGEGGEKRRTEVYESGEEVDGFPLARGRVGMTDEGAGVGSGEIGKLDLGLVMVANTLYVCNPIILLIRTMNFTKLVRNLFQYSYSTYSTKCVQSVNCILSRALGSTIRLPGGVAVDGGMQF
jgi:hypothetical protein